MYKQVYNESPGTPKNSLTCQNMLVKTHIFNCRLLCGVIYNASYCHIVSIRLMESKCINSISCNIRHCVYEIPYSKWCEMTVTIWKSTCVEQIPLDSKYLASVWLMGIILFTKIMVFKPIQVIRRQSLHHWHHIIGPSYWELLLHWFLNYLLWPCRTHQWLSNLWLFRAVGIKPTCCPEGWQFNSIG